MNNQATQEKLTHRCGCNGLACLPRGAGGRYRAKYTADELIGHLVDAESDERTTVRLARLLKGARFRYQASFEQYSIFRRCSQQSSTRMLLLRLSRRHLPCR